MFRAVCRAVCYMTQHIEKYDTIWVTTCVELLETVVLFHVYECSLTRVVQEPDEDTKKHEKELERPSHERIKDMLTRPVGEDDQVQRLDEATAESLLTLLRENLNVKFFQVRKAWLSDCLLQCQQCCNTRSSSASITVALIESS